MGGREIYPKDEKKGGLVALRKLGRREVKRLLSSKTVESPQTAKRRAIRKKYRR